MFGLHFGKKEATPSMSEMQAGDLEVLRKNTRRNELIDRIARLKEMAEKAQPGTEARTSFEKQIVDTQAELGELDGKEPEKPEQVN